MGETILLVIVLLLSLYGCMELIRCIALRILKPYEPYRGILVMPIKGHCDDMEYMVRAAATHSRWASSMNDCVVLVDDGMDIETRAIAQRMCTQYPNVSLSKPEEFQNMFVSDLH